MRATPPQSNPRFQVGDHVVVTKKGFRRLLGRITAIDSTRPATHYVLDFGSGPLVWLPEDDLAEPEAQRGKIS